MFSIFRHPKLAEKTPLSSFVREASAHDKRRVYARVISKAAEEQKALMNSAEAIRQDRERHQAA
ncbi:MAG: hypothetical protein EON54_08555 [Alcaligenaceae bacterium]|nr:MAG: hypothetical protein EON54_08555 [Alcaligenaceae bacterium]